MINPSPEETELDMNVEKLADKMNYWRLYRAHDVVKFEDLTDAERAARCGFVEGYMQAQAERQRTMPSREEFTSWLSASVWVGIGRSPLEIYDWIESRMNTERPVVSDVCNCGHKKADHIYEEGACRPGFVCECKGYRAALERK